MGGCYHEKFRDDPSNALMIGEDKNHVDPILPIPEPKLAIDRIM
jgi:hypothetical protein